MSGISSSRSPNNTPNRNKFNGIEETRDLDLNQYDALYRTLDPQIGRWFQIDPKPTYRESPYSAMSNNPVFNIDPLGDTIINGQPHEPTNSANATFLENVSVKGVRVTSGYNSINVSCHISNQEVALAQQSWWYNATKNLDKEHGQVMPPRSPVIDFFLGQREIDDPDYSEDGFLDEMETGLQYVGSDGYMKGPVGMMKTGTPLVGMKGVPGGISRFGQIRGGIKKAQELTKRNHNLKLLSGKRIDLKGRHPLSRGHFNKVTKEQLRYPHVNDPTHPGGDRAPNANDYIEIFNLFK